MASTSRPEPMNASPYHPKVKVTCILSDPLYVAGGFIAGKMEVECRTDKGLGLGVIMAELSAIEELTSRDHSATSTFYHTRRLFQGPGLPPSNSVHAHPPAGSPPLSTNYYYARKGMTTFLFRFPLPPSSPSSINFGSGLATIRYEVRATVGVSYKGENKLVFDKKEVDIVEAFEPDFSRVDPEAVIIGESGKIWLQARLLGGVVVAGQPACVELTVKNHSLKKNTGLNLSLSRHLYFPNVPPSQNAPFQISDVLTTVPFKGPDYVIHPGTEGVASLVFDTPKNSRGVSGGQRPGNEDSMKQIAPLFGVKCIVTVTMAMGLGSKDLVVEIPVTILHHKAFHALLQEPEPPMPLARSQQAYDQSHAPATSIPVMYTGRPTSPYDYIPPQPIMSPHPGLPYVDHGNMWLPYGVVPQLPYHALPQPTQQYYYPPPQSSLIPLYTGNGMLPIRSSSTEPAPSQPLHSFYEVPPHVQSPQQLLPFPAGAEPQHYCTVGDAETEQGKGERAERVSLQLRMSTRARSSSPSYHRFPIHPPPTQGQPLFGSPPPDQPISPTNCPMTRKPSVHLTIQNLPPPLARQHTGGSGELHSPRPILSPKTSFAVDPFTNEIRGMTKDERIENLEKMAEEAVRENSDMSGSGGVNPVTATDVSPRNRFPQIEKTLPLPPPPPAGEPVRVDRLFPPTSLVLEEEVTPKTPTLTATTPFKLGRSMYRHLNAPDSGGGATSGLSGLDALEARLIAEVGTRKLDKDDAKPDVRSVLAVPIDIPNVRGRTTNKGGGLARSPGENSASVYTHGISDDINDSAISSLTLAGEGKSPVANALRYEEAGGGGPRTLRTGRSRSRDRLDPITDDKVEKVQTPRNRERRSSTGKKSTTSGHKEGGKSEGRKMRKAAVGRVADWLGKIDPEAPPPQVDTPPTSPLSDTEHLHPLDPTSSPVFTPSYPGSPEVSTRSSLREVELSKTPISSRPLGLGKEEPEETGAEPELSASPNPRSSGFMPIHPTEMRGPPSPGRDEATSTPKPPPVQLPWMQKLEATEPTRTGLNITPRFGKGLVLPDLAAKYDVRSARGGRGGRVTAVAAIWAAAEKQNGSANIPVPRPWVNPQAPGKPIIAPKPTRPAAGPKPAGLSVTKPAVTNLALGKIDVGKVRPTQGVSNPHAGEDDEEETPTTGTDHTRARMVKSSSVPAVISSSTAIPMISSTASLIRPPGSSPVRERPGKVSRGFGTRIATIEEDLASDWTSVGAGPTRGGEGKPHAVGSPTKTDLAFGQARLRDLIRKYQG